jgi:predicted GNAT family N-acyltransferase
VGSRGRAPSPRPPQLASPSEPPSCEIRVLDSVADLVEAYQLRYDVYGALGYLARSNRSRLEIDEYDASAIPFGAFDPANGALIGTARLVTLERQPDYAQLMRRAVADTFDAELTRQALGTRPHPLPSIISPEVWRSIDEFNSDGFAVHELGRTIVHPRHRGSGVSRGLIELGLAHAAQFEPAVVIGSCRAEHIPMFARYGYVPLPNTAPALYDSIGQIAHAVVCRTDQLPEPTRTHVEELLSAMASGTKQRTLELGPNSRAVFRFTHGRRSRRRTVEW